MIAHDDDLYDSIAALALGVLPAAEAEPLAKHVSLCSDCRLLYATFRSSADLVGYEAEAVGERFDEVSRFRLKSRIMKSIRATDTPSVPSINGANVDRRKRDRSPRAWIAYACAVAAIVIAALDTIANSSLSSENARLAKAASQQANIAAGANARARELDLRLAQLVAPDAKRYPIADGEVVASVSRIVIAMRDLPPPPAGKTYQAWTRARGATVMTPGATFAPDASGVAVVELPVASTNVDAVAVSIEPIRGSKAPTSKPAFVRALS